MPQLGGDPAGGGAGAWARRIGAELLARPAREPLWQALVNAMLACYEGADQAPGPRFVSQEDQRVAVPLLGSVSCRAPPQPGCR